MSRVLMISLHPDTFHCVRAILRLGQAPSKAKLPANFFSANCS
jgi:hypothetical protein